MDSSGDTEDNIQHLKQERHISGDLKNGCEVSSKIKYVNVLTLCKIV